MSYTAAEYQALLQQLLPLGAAWPRDANTVLAQTLLALAAEWARLDGRVDDLRDEADPRSTDELLPDWERVAGLPDICTGTLPTVARRRAALLHRLIDLKGQTPAYFIAQAEAFLNAAPGSVTITYPYDPFRAGDPCGKACQGDAWAHVWDVHIPAGQDFFYFRAGEGRAGDPLRWWSTSQVECLIRREKPAHTVVRFFYLWPGEEEIDPENQNLLLGIMRML